MFVFARYIHNFEDAHFEHNRIDAIAMERLTASPHVINIYAFCGHTVVTEFADGTRVGSLADQFKHRPLQRLRIARDVALGLADIHGIDGDGNTTFIHFDVNPSNVVVIGNELKFNDFNIGIPIRWNSTSNARCHVHANYANPQVRRMGRFDDPQEIFVTSIV
jgi:serine/threonine protein kinase